MPGSLMSEFRLRSQSQPPEKELRPPPSDPQAPSDLIDLGQLWAAVRGKYRFILAVSCLVGVSVMAYTFASRMSFRASGRLYLGEIDGKSKAAAPASGELALLGDGQSEVASEIEILRSRSLVTRAIVESGINTTLARVGEGPTRYLPWLLAHRDLRLVDGLMEELTVSNTVLSDKAALEPKKYSLHFLSENEYEVSDEQKSLGRGSLGQPLKTAELSLTLLPGSVRRPKPGARYELIVQPLDLVIDRTLDLLLVTAPKQSGSGEFVSVLTLDFRDGSPHRAASFLENLMRAYLGERQAWKTEDATAAEAFVGGQLTGMRHSLDDVQQKLADYRTNNEVVVQGHEAEAMIAQIGKYEEQRLAARLQVAALTDVKRALSSPNPPMGAFLMGEANDTVLEGMANSLSQERSKLADLEARFNDVAPDVREQHARVDAQLAGIRNYVSSRAARAQDSLSSLSALIQQLQERLKTVPGAELGLAQLSREAEVYSKTYSYLLERQQQAGIIKASTLSKNRVLDLPEIPLREDSPKLLLRLASFLGGLVLGAAFVAIRSIWSGNLQSQSDVQRAACGVPLFGVVPFRQRKAGSGRKSEAEALLQALNDGPHSAFTEAFRVLRATLRHWVPLGRGGVLLVTSPRSGDGKTTVVLALAAVLAAEGKRVLVIDADMSRPSPSASSTDGATLNAVLCAESRWHQAVCGLALPFTKLYIIPAGGPTRHDGSSYERRAKLLEEARENFDFVLIDSPSFPPAADALTWASLADGVISVVRLGHSPRKLTTEHLTRLTHFAQAFAIVINDAGPAGRDRVRPIASQGPTGERAFDARSTWPGVGGAPAYTPSEALSRFAVAAGADTTLESRPEKRPPPWSESGNG